jgi:prepilin-type N-terminal cleavage/methylation domain-containing protein
MPIARRVAHRGPVRRPVRHCFSDGGSFSEAGFTLIELLTVMAIIAILSAISIGVIQGTRTRAGIARTRSELAALVVALEDFKRHYGDYPQLGDFGQAPLNPASTTTGPGAATVQARLFNSLTGVFGPARFTPDDRLAGPTFLDAGRFTLNGTLATNYQLVTAQPPKPPFKTEQNVSILDPWGHPYLYYYKRASNPAAWRSPTYVLYSAGPDGAQTLPINQATGIFNATQPTNNADNLYAQPP